MSFLGGCKCLEGLERDLASLLVLEGNLGLAFGLNRLGFGLDWFIVVDLDLDCVLLVLTGILMAGLSTAFSLNIVAGGLTGLVTTQEGALLGGVRICGILVL